MQILPESFLFDLIPEGVAAEDRRHLMAALCGGFQDRLEDLRTLSGKQALLLDPLAELPDLGPSVLATWRNSTGASVSRFIPVDDTTPEESDRLLAWASSRLGVQLSSAVRADDPLKAITANTLQHTAASFGATLYKTPASGSVSSLDDQRRILAGYFFRLRIKGTLRSFEILGRLMGFGDVAVIPLWGRLSPRIPNDVGNSANDPDFLASPEVPPAQVVSVLGYDPHNFTDGPFFSWSSGALSATSTAANFVTTVNGKQPWFKVIATGSVTLPTNGSTITLAGGGPHAKASASPGGTNLKFEAIAEGASFNGLAISVSGGGLSVSDYNLSRVKYRTSYFNLGLTTEFEAFSDRFGEPPVSSNPDLQANATLCQDGTALAPYRPWSGPTPRVQASGSTKQMNQAKLNEIGVQALQYFEETRPASRFPRKVSFGFMHRDAAGYADFNTRSVLATVADGTTTYAGEASGWPLPGYTASIIMEPPGAAPVPLVGENVVNPDGSISADLINFRAAGAAGYYRFSDNTFSFEITGQPSGTLLVARWLPTTTEVVRPRPLVDAALRGRQARPEDESAESAGSGLGMSEDIIWARSVPVDGVVVDRGVDRPADPPASLLALDPAMTVRDAAGREYDVQGYDPTAGSARPIRFRLLLRPIGSLTSTVPEQTAAYRPGRQPLCLAAGELHSVGVVGSVVNGHCVLAADPTRWRQLEDGLKLWWPLNQHPAADLTTYDHAHAAAAQPALVAVQPADRAWDSGRGWTTKMRSGARVQAVTGRLSTGGLTVLAWVNPTGVSTLTAGPVIISTTPGQVVVKVTHISGEQTVATVSATGFSSAVVTIDGTACSARVNATTVSATLSSAVRLAETVGRHRGAWAAQSSSSVGGNTVVTAGLYRAGDVVSYSGRDWVAKVDAPPSSVPSIGSNWRYSVQQVVLDGGTGSPAWHDIRVWSKVGVDTARALAPGLDAAQPAVGYVNDPRGITSITVSGTTATATAADNHGLSTGNTVIVSGAVPAGFNGSKVVTVTGSTAFTYTVASGLPDASGRPGFVTGLTPVLQQPHFYTLAQRAQWGLAARANGWCYPDGLPDGRRRQDLARARHYLGNGRWNGDRRLKEVGLGGDSTPPGIDSGTWQLGRDFYEVDADGTTVVSTPGAIPGQNPGWSSKPSIRAKFAVSLTRSGTTATATTSTSHGLSTGNTVIITGATPVGYNGSVVVTVTGATTFTYTVASGLSTPATGRVFALAILAAPGLAAQQDAQNSGRDSIWIRGDSAEGGCTYKVYLKASGNASPTLVAERTFMPKSTAERLQVPASFTGPARLYVDQPAGAETIVATASGGLAVRRSSQQLADEASLNEAVRNAALADLSGEVYARSDRALASAPPVYLSLDSRIYSDLGKSGLQAVWSNVTTEGNLAGYPLRNDAGQFIFLMTFGTAMPAGKYRFEVEAENVGTVDPNFSGFDVTATLTATGETTAAMVVAGKLVASPSTVVNPKGTTVFEFDLAATVSSGQLVIEWTNDADAPESGFNRSLAINRVVFRKLETSIYAVSVASGPVVTLTQVSLGSYSSSKPGGWVARLNHNGTLASAVHESAIYPSLSAYEGGGSTSKVPLSDLLTGSTGRRRSRLALSNPRVPADSSPSAPVLGSVSVVVS